MKLSAAYKWAGHVVPGSWPDWKDHMARAGEDGEGAEVGLRETGARVGGGSERCKAEGAGGIGGGGKERTAWTHAQARAPGPAGAPLPAPPALSITTAAAI